MSRGHGFLKCDERAYCFSFHFAGKDTRSLNHTFQILGDHLHHSRIVRRKFDLTHHIPCNDLIPDEYR